jgi:Ca-activated chloride channel family protein
VTAFYEIVPTTGETLAGTDLKYQDTRIRESAHKSPELLTLRVRYKKPDEDLGREMSEIMEDGNQTVDKASANMCFASAVAEFGLLLRDSRYQGSASFEGLIERARKAMGEDVFGIRHEFIRLAETAAILIENRKQNQPSGTTEK